MRTATSEMPLLRMKQGFLKQALTLHNLVEAVFTIRTGAGQISYVSLKHPISLYTILSQETNKTKQNLLIESPKSEEGNGKLY